MYIPISQEHQLYFILIFSYSGYPIEDISCCFEYSFLTKPFYYHFVSPTEGSNQNFSRVSPTYILFLFYARIRISTTVKLQKPTRCSLLSVKQLNHCNDIDQEQFSVVRRDFTVLYENPLQSYRRLTQVIKPIRSSSRSW